jgi:hypothetical protein
MKYLAILLLLASTGCAPRLGAHVWRHNVRGVSYYHCTVVANEQDLHLAELSLDVCKEAIEHPQQPAPLK